jgi:uncharacterized CHY-type Zn-finger protein
MSTSGKKKTVQRRAARPNTPEVRGLNLDPQTRCLHHHQQVDVIAIKMKCCATYYACKDCHIALAGHAIEVWPRSEWKQEAVLCGACGARLTIRQYMRCGSRCPVCSAPFNPGCQNHHHVYFEEKAPIGRGNLKKRRSSKKMEEKPKPAP